MMLAHFEQKAARAAKKTGLALGGGLCIAVGVAFLTAAAWIYLSQVLEPLMAALIIGGAYAGLGLILVGLTGRPDAPAQRHPKQSPPPQDAANGAQPPLMQAFLFGMQAGANAGGKPKPH